MENETQNQIELMSDGGLAVIDPRRAAVCALSDVVGGQYLDEAGLTLCFPSADARRGGALAVRELSRQRQSARLLLTPGERPAAFSHPFELHVQFDLKGAALRVGCMLSNPADTPLPFFLGVDIALRSPVQAGDEAADYALEQAGEDVCFLSRRSGRGTAVKTDGFMLLPSPGGPAGSLRFAVRPDATALAPLSVLRAQLTLEML